jgi:hypothetical protein
MSEIFQGCRPHYSATRLKWNSERLGRVFLASIVRLLSGILLELQNDAPGPDLMHLLAIRLIQLDRPLRWTQTRTCAPWCRSFWGPSTQGNRHFALPSTNLAGLSRVAWCGTLADYRTLSPRSLSRGVAWQRRWHQAGPPACQRTRLIFELASISNVGHRAHTRMQGTLNREDVRSRSALG